MIQKPRGTMDILPNEIAKWQFIEETARKVFKKRGFGEIRFPTFEETQLFSRGVGDNTDIVQKEMFTFVDRDNVSYSLRPEGTACVARAIIENGLASDVMPLKMFYTINCFRYEKPQKGRYREFYQFGAELFGSLKPSADVELIALADEVLHTIGLKNYKLHINSIGCPDCRPQYKNALKTYFASNEADLCDTCKNRLQSNPMRILDCKSEICSKIAHGAPKTIDFLCEECEMHFDSLKQRLDTLKIDYVIDSRIVRGLDYYNRTVFEFISEGIGAQNTICGGGRYDGLVEQIGGISLPGTGFAMGVNRLILCMEDGSNFIDNTEPVSLYIASLCEEASIQAMYLVEFLRLNGYKAEYDIVGRSLKSQMKYANKINTPLTLIIGEEEMKTKTAKLRNMQTGEQNDIAIDNGIEILRIIKEITS